MPKKLIVEVMGKHSNIIFCDENDHIIDSIKHISAMVSSVREVLPDVLISFPKRRINTIPCVFQPSIHRKTPPFFSRPRKTANS